MAKFLAWSDLHCEFKNFEIPIPSCQPGGLDTSPARAEIDAILLGGDIAVNSKSAQWALRMWDIWRCPVVMIDGNHEPYGSKRIQKHWAVSAGQVEQMQSAGADIRLLRPGTTVVGDTRIIGATLWADLNLWGGARVETAGRLKEQVTDYGAIRFHDVNRDIYRKLIPSDTVAMHHADKAFILGELAKPFEGQTLVMTHHTPVVELLDPEMLAQRDPVTASYASDLWPELRGFRIDTWFSGHAHSAREVTLEGGHGAVEFRTNPRGYPGEHTSFDPLRVLDTGKPAPDCDPDVMIPGSGMAGL